MVLLIALYLVYGIQRCLRWNPEERPTPREALCHKWLASDTDLRTLVTPDNVRGQRVPSAVYSSEGTPSSILAPRGPLGSAAAALGLFT